MTVTPHTTHDRRHAHGSAMFEMCLTLPFIFVILIMLVFFGRDIVRVQHAMVMDRYEAWRRAAGSPQPGYDEASHDDAALNSMFFGDKAELIESESDSLFPNEANHVMIAYASQYASDTGTLARLHRDRADRGRHVSLITRHAEGNGIKAFFNRPIESDHMRIGNEWAWVNAWTVRDGVWQRQGEAAPNMPANVRDLFFEQFDESLNAVADDQDNLAAAALRRYYLHLPPYVGPVANAASRPPAPRSAPDDDRIN